MFISKKTMKEIFGVSDTASGLSIDSRKVHKGNVFFCIKGNKLDGHEFAEQAFQKGAKYVVAHRKLSLSEKYMKYIIYVNNTDNALIKLTENVRQSLTSLVIGITGTAGKTSTKEQMLCAFQDVDVIATPESYNTIYGLALTICNLPHIPEYLILELGINKPGEMEQLAAIANPDYSIITNIGQGHIENFKDLKHIAQSKSIILNHTKKHAIFPEICKQYCPKNLQYTINDCPFNDIKEYNSFSIMHIAKLENIPNASINIKTFQFSKGRNNIKILSKENQEFTIIDGSFNSNPISLERSIQQLQSYSERKIAVLGEMKELGDNTKKYHDVDFNVDILILLGEWSSITGIIFKDYKKVCSHLDMIIREGDVILFKGSNSTDIKLIVQYIENKYENHNI